MKPIILSLDTDNPAQAHHLVGSLRGYLAGVKIGHIALSSLGVDFLQNTLKGIPVLLDLKFFDIPNTLITAIKNYKTLFDSLEFFTFFGGLDDLTIKQLLTLNLDLKPVGVFVLSSEEIDNERFLKMAKRNFNLGVQDFICPPAYIHLMRSEFGHKVRLYSPGIRQAKDQTHDHQIQNQADHTATLDNDYSIIGRPLLHANDPIEKIQEYL